MVTEARQLNVRSMIDPSFAPRATDSQKQSSTVPQYQQLISWTLAAQDAILIYVAFGFAYLLRYTLQVGPSFRDLTPFSGYQTLAVLLLGLMMPMLVLKGAYRARMSQDVVDQTMTIIGVATMSVAAVVVITTMMHSFEYSRGVIVYLWLSLIVILPIGRVVHQIIRGICHRKGMGVQRVLVVGGADTARMIMQNLRNRPDLGYEIVGFVDRRNRSRLADFGRFKVLGTIEDIPEVVATHKVDEIIVALPASEHERVYSEVQRCERSDVRLKLVPDLFELNLSRVQMDDIAGIPLLSVQENRSRIVDQFLKRTLDFLVSSVVFILSLPIIAFLAVLIKLDSPGPAFIKQERVGKDGRRFSCMKLRTMRVDADKMLPLLQAMNEASGPIFKMRNDPRLTRLGRHIRRLSLDELPQVWNVLRGEMSLVGPRPPLPREVTQYADWQMRRLGTKPGMTGIWQVSGRSHLSFDEMVMMDIFYVDNWTAALDVKILMRTAIAVLAARGAY